MKLSGDITRFEEIRSRGEYYIDRTPYIKKLEKSNERFVICLRPREFDRHLFISMLGSYYGLEFKNRFRKLFKDLYIGKNPTPNANSYHVLKLDFSNMNINAANDIQKQYLSIIKLGIKDFFRRYKHTLSYQSDGLLSQPDPSTLLNMFFQPFQNIKLFVFINEYDHFLPEILDPEFNDFPPFIRLNPMIRRIYQTLKQASNNGSVDRIFVVGIDKGVDRIKR